jgi:hypothetical protein
MGPWSATIIIFLFLNAQINLNRQGQRRRCRREYCTPQVQGRVMIPADEEKTDAAQNECDKHSGDRVGVDDQVICPTPKTRPEQRDVRRLTR